jgi:PTH2 family peptidyl-tRNA hydrolase
MDTKQVIVLRNDLAMPAGKAASQAAHASIAWISKRLSFQPDEKLLTWSVPAIYSAPEIDWLSGSFTKIVLQAALEDLLHIYYEAKENELEAHLIVDEGRTVFDGIPTPTAVAIGPDRSDKIDPITGALKLYA